MEETLHESFQVRNPQFQIFIGGGLIGPTGGTETWIIGVFVGFGGGGVTVVVVGGGVTVRVVVGCGPVFVGGAVGR